MTDYYVDEDHEGLPDPGDDLYDPEDGPVGPPRRSLRVGGQTEIEGQTTWMYLGLLTALFALIVGFSWACDVEPTTPTDFLPTEGEAPVQAGEVATRLQIVVDGGVVTVTGPVPDEGAKGQVLAGAASLYGAENVIDEIVVDETTTLEAGVVDFQGTVDFGDSRPASLRDAITSTLGLTVGEFEVSEREPIIDPVALQAEVLDGAARFTGVVPDEASIAELRAAGEAVWGPGSVDLAGVSVGDASWDEGTVTLTGTAAPGDQRHLALPDEIRARFGNLVQIDVSGVAIDTGPEALAEIEAAIAEAVAAQAITFERNSAEIDTASDAVLVTIAGTLRDVPGIPVEVIGHTDDQGPDDENLLLSQQRAEAVVARLVELGVDGARLTATGLGETTPIADNTTPEGQAQNRRIEFVLG